MESEGQGRHAPKPVPVRVTAGIIELCNEFAERCNRLRQYSGAGGWRGGLIRPMTLFGGIDVDSSTAGIVIGKVGEAAMCILAGQPIDLALKDRGDGGRDLSLPCGSVQVKTSRKRYANNLVREPVEQCDWFVFATWDGTTPVVEIDGYASRAVVASMPIEPSRRGSWMNREVPYDALRPIRSLLAIRPISEVV